MPHRHGRSKTWALYLKVPRGFKEKLLAFLTRVLDHFLQSPPFKKALVDVVQKNQANVREILDIWGTGFSGKEKADATSPAAYYTELNASKRAVEDIVLSHTLNNKRPPDSPECSVVIPVWNKDYFTYLSIRSLLKAKVNSTFEIIVVDNGSTDNTPEILEYFGAWVRVVRNDENKGFVIAANQGAAAAKGKFLVFLNNDTEVPDGWLDRLVETVKMSEDIGAVGAKMIYPEGVLQEAGDVVWSDGTATNYGWREDPRDFKYIFMREADYCGASCLLVRRDVFERVGGFDMRYVPAYYEDIDLCFGIRSLGYKVVYQPRCEVIHYEGATGGKETDSGYKRFQVINKEKFKEKWREVLKRQPPVNWNTLDVDSDRRTGPSILFIDYQIPRYDQDSGSYKIFNFVKILSQMGCRVSFLFRTGEKFDRYCLELGGIGIRLTKEEGGQVWDELKAGMYDLVLIDRVSVAELYLPRVKEADPKVPVVFETADLHFIREMRMAELLGDKKMMADANKTMEKELAIARTCDLTVAITEVDKKFLLDKSPSLNVMVIPNVHQPVNVKPSVEGRDALMFIGHYPHPPNVDAMLYFVKDVLPLIRRELENVELLVVGSKPPDEIKALAADGITVTGYVPDTTPYFRRSRVFVAPLRYGAGMKGKIGEAMSHGVPVVTSSIGAEGMGLVHGETAMVQDDPEAFAADVVRLYRDEALWMKLAEQGKRHIDKNFGPESVSEKLAVLKDLASKHAASRGAVRFYDAPKGYAADDDKPLAGPGFKKKARIDKNGKGIVCLRPFYFTELTSEGNVHSCCPAWIKRPIGNLRDNTLDEIWNSEQALFIREKMYAGEWQDICNDICPIISKYKYDKKLIEFDTLERFDFLTPAVIEEVRERKVRLGSSPTTFNLSNSTICNLSCIMCYRFVRSDDSDLIKKTTADIMKHLPTARRIIMSGMGDPFARPDTRDILMNYRGNNPDIKFQLITNGLLLPKYWGQIKHQNFASILISVDAATKETYELIRKPGKWENILKCLDVVKSNKEKLGNIEMDMTVMRANYKEIPAFIDLAESYGFNTRFHSVVGQWGDQNIFELKDKEALDDLRKILAVENGKHRNIKVIWSDLIEFIDAGLDLPSQGT